MFCRSFLLVDWVVLKYDDDDENQLELKLNRMLVFFSLATKDSNSKDIISKKIMVFDDDDTDNIRLFFLNVLCLSPFS